MGGGGNEVEEWGGGEGLKSSYGRGQFIKMRGIFLWRGVKPSRRYCVPILSD